MNLPPNNDNLPASPDSEGERMLVDYEHWVHLADASDRQQYFESWLAIISASVGPVSFASVLVNEQDSLRAVASWPQQASRLHTDLQQLADETLSEQRALVSSASDSETLLAYPLILDQGVSAVVAMRVGITDDSRLALALQQLQLGSAWLELLFRREESTLDERLVDQAISTLGLMSRVSGQEASKDAATELVTSISASMQCERVMFGMRKGNDIKVTAVSNSGQFGRKMNLVKLTEQAMLEAIDQSAAIRFPSDTGNAGQVVIRQQALLAESGSDYLMTVPFYRDDKWTGAMLLERSAGKPFSSEELDLVETTVSIAGGQVLDKQRAEQSLFKIFSSRLGRFLRNALRIAYPVRTAVFLALASALAFGFLVDGQFSVKGRASLEGLVERSVVAPFDGYIELSKKRVGDRVVAGEVLGEMDTSELELELIELNSKKAQAESQIRQSQASGNRAQVNILQTQSAQVDAQISLLNNQMERTVLKAPYDGYIVRGDLTRNLGAAISRGEILFVIAPLQAYRVVMQIGEKDIAHIDDGSDAQLVLSALPSDVFDLAVSKVTPVAEAAEGLNAFRVEAEIVDQSQQLRPGMQGVVRIDGGNRKWIWIWTREFIDWLRLVVWRWMP